MNHEEARKLSENALEELATQLDGGKSIKLTAFLDRLARFHHYSFGNVLLITVQRPDASHVAGFGTWKKLGRYVKKGEHGIAILAPITYRPKSDEEATEDRSTVKVVHGFKVVHVFDVSQTDGKPMPEFATVGGDPGEYTPRIKALIQERGIELSVEPILGGADGISQGGKITVRPSLPPAKEFSVLAHELAHELLHRGERRAETTRTIRETEAEAVAYVVTKAVGLTTATAASDYILLYSGTKETLADSLEHIQKTAASILEALMPAT